MEKVFVNKYIVFDPNICHGKSTFKGTRIMVWQVLDLLKSGQSKENIYSSYPTLPKGSVEAALEYTAAKVKERIRVS